MLKSIHPFEDISMAGMGLPKYLGTEKKKKQLKLQTLKLYRKGLICRKRKIRGYS